MAKRNFSSAVDLSLKGRPSPVKENIELEEQNSNTTVTEPVNVNLTNVSEKNQISEEPPKKENSANDTKVINENIKIINQGQNQEIAPQVEEKSGLQADMTQSSSQLNNDKKDDKKDNKKISISSWLPIEYRELYEAAGYLNKNSSQYVNRLVLEDLEKNRSKYQKVADSLKAVQESLKVLQNI